MSLFGGIVLSLGAVLVAVLAGYKIIRIVRRRGGFPAKAASYANRLDPDAENGAHDEVHQMAEALIREHGPSAVIEAARRSISKLDDGDLKGQAVWQRVLESAKESQRRREGRGNGSAG
jgi:hypothetical protein